MDITQNLNSVLLEGNLISAPTRNENGMVRFLIASKYSKTTETGSVSITFKFPIVAFGRLGVICFDTLRKGRGVRVVGKLVQEEASDDAGIPPIFIMAEHVELKPIIAKEKVKAS